MVAMLVAFAAPALADDRDRFDHFDFDDGFSQSSEQEADSGDVDQSFDVTGGDDNSNQTVGTQGVANTGNAQDQFNFTDFGNFDDFDRNDFDRNDFDHFFFDDDFNHFNGNGGDFSVEDSGASIEVSPTNATLSNQDVDEAASAFGSR
jgi:hypothetical protein